MSEGKLLSAEELREIQIRNDGRAILQDELNTVVDQWSCSTIGKLLDHITALTQRAEAAERELARIRGRLELNAIEDVVWSAGFTRDKDASDLSNVKLEPYRTYVAKAIISHITKE